MQPDEPVRNPAPLPEECPHHQPRLSRTAFDAVGGFDEAFAYGSDIDFTWRLTDDGYRIRSAPDAMVRHDWGGPPPAAPFIRLRPGAHAALQKAPPRLRRVLRDDP